MFDILIKINGCISSMPPLELINATTVPEMGESTVPSWASRIELITDVFEVLLKKNSGDYPSLLMITSEACWPQSREETLANKISLSSISILKLCIRC